MADAVIYSSLDPAGPGLRPSNSTENNSLSVVTRTFALLSACLVTGYGSGAQAKPGQGWVVVHADLPNGFTLRAPDGVFYIFSRGQNVPATGTSQGQHGCQVFMAEALSAPYSYPPTGASVRSGDYASSNPGDPNRHWMSLSDALASEIHWFLIARGSQVFFIRSLHAWEGSNNFSASNDAFTSAGMFFFGNVLLNDPVAPRSGPQCSLAQGGYISAATATGIATLNSNALGSFLAGAGSDSPVSSLAGATRLRNFVSGEAEAGALVRTSCNPAKHGNVTMSRAVMPAFPADLKLEQVDVWLNGVGSVAKLPGAFHGGRSCHYRTMDLLVALGKGSSIADCLTPATINGEPFYVIPTFYGSLLFSLAEKYWV